MQLFAQSQPGAEVDSASLIVLDKIGKTPRDSLTVPDVHAANKWLCEATGGVLDDDYRCSQSRVYSFSDKAALSDLRRFAAHSGPSHFILVLDGNTGTRLFRHDNGFTVWSLRMIGTNDGPKMAFAGESTLQ